MVGELQQLFERGILVRSSDREPNFVHMVRAICALCGVTDLPLNRHSRELMHRIGPSDKLIFILLDGLGMNIVDRLPAESFLRSTLYGELIAPCPSTTAAALTTVSTALYPSQHGVTGWFTYLPEFGLAVTMLPFAERFSKQPLGFRGIRPSDVLPPPVLSRMTHRPFTLVPAYISNTPYNEFSRGGTSGRGYETLASGIDQVIQAVTGSTGPTYIHFYLHDIDTLCHHVGVKHDSVIPLVLGIDAQLQRLADAVKGRARIVLSADHGLIDVPKPHQHQLFDGDPLLEMLAVPPTGDARQPIFHVRPEKRASFVELFERRYGDWLALVSVDHAEQMELYGPGPMSPTVRSRFGDFIAFPTSPTTLEYRPPGKPADELYLALHGGLSPQEMRIPFCLA